MVIWITGLSGAGKTSIAKAVFSKLKEKQDNVVLLDGDVIRKVICDEFGYSVEARGKSAGRISRLCHWLNQQGIDVVCATISFFEEIRRWNRENIDDYFEVYVRTSMEVLMKRDRKSFYRRAWAGEIRNVVGVDLKLLPPQNPDLIIDNDNEQWSFEDLGRQVLESIPGLAQQFEQNACQ